MSRLKKDMIDKIKKSIAGGLSTDQIEQELHVKSKIIDRYRRR